VRRIAVSVTLTLLLGAACNRGTDLTGAGASFPYPLYSKWAAEYDAHAGRRVNYQPSGSGAGIRQLSEGTVDFGGSDSPMSDAQLAEAKHGRVLHIPTTLGAVAVIYNLPEVAEPLRITSDVVADIFLRRITKWNDPRIAASNRGAALPARDILVARRSDGSGTTYIFTDYLSKVSPAWAAGPGKGKAVSWPAGTLGGRANEGVAAQVQQTPGAIGYVELAYASRTGLPAALLGNAAGNFVAPTVESITAAAAGVADTLSPTSDFRISIVNAPGANAYPIVSFTWILVYERHADAERGRKLVDFLMWAVTEGQQYAAPLHYAPLPAQISDGVQKRLAAMTLGAS
jgi:phosphate transport system substrate-binding protein